MTFSELLALVGSADFARRIRSDSRLVKKAMSLSLWRAVSMTDIILSARLLLTVRLLWFAKNRPTVEKLRL